MGKPERQSGDHQFIGTKVKQVGKYLMDKDKDKVRYFQCKMIKLE